MNARDFRDKAAHIPVAREGVPYLVGAMFVTLTTAVLGHTILTWLGLAVVLLMGHFFRDPERIGTPGETEALSPADGKVLDVERVEDAHFFSRPSTKISIFMSIFDVHVNRVPLSGTVRGISYEKGSFMAAGRARASRENERNWLWIEAETGHDVVLTQVAGLIARRIVCWPRVGDRVIAGERFGLIRFGSRVDVYLPETVEVTVRKGQHVYAGETVLCRLR
ncbi:MAG TPA: phosphatidylserine decarboxylase family protein [Syntrophobacteraceae bacterium]|nr:phosphatidylserine decarboxylase family protein [Syntrophobacteraceae bacterium]